MAKRILLGGVVGGIVLFVWASLSHMVLGLGEVGLQSLPNEDVVMETMRANITQPGLYFFPGMDPARQNDEAYMKDLEEKAVRGPAGLMVYRVHGEPFSAKLLSVEFASDVLIGLLAAALLAQIGGAFLGRVVAAGMMGLIGGLDIYVSYWNWYGFPSNYITAVMCDEVIGFLLMGAAIAAIVKKQ